MAKRKPKTYRFQLSIGEITDEYQRILPVIKSKSHKYGALDITSEMINAMVKHWDDKVMGEREPYLDLDHWGGEAAGWFGDIQAREDGLYVKIEWTELGREKVEKKLYRYFSAEFGEYMGLEDGQLYYPVLYGAALTNRPLMNNLSPAHLSDHDPAHSDGEENTEGVSDMETLKEILDALFALGDEERGKATDEDRGKVAKFLGIKLSEGTDADTQKLADESALLKRQLTAVMSERDGLAQQIADSNKAKLAERKATVIELAIKSGKILPVNREVWEQAFDANPENTEKLLLVKGAEVDLSEHGSGTGGGEQKFAAAEIQTFHKLGLTDEDIQNEGGKV